MRPRKVRRRFFRIGLVFFGMMLDFTREFRIMKKKGYAAAAAKMAPRHDRRAKKLYELSIEMGGVLVKLSQFFSARRDIFPEEYVKRLSPLQDNVPALPFMEIEKVLIAEFGDYRNVFLKIDETPLASASLGQVHKVVLSDGREAAIKILKPGIEDVFDLDFAILHKVFSFITRFEALSKHGDFMSMLEEFITVTGDEMNFRREVHVMKVLRESFAASLNIRIPEVYDDYCTSRVIVMEYCPGIKINERSALIEAGHDPRALARLVMEVYLEQIVRMPYIHFDPHPGNILVDKKGRIILLDFGMAGELSDKMRNGLKDGAEALIDRDARKLVDALYRIGLIRKGVNRYTLLPVLEYFMEELIDVIDFDRESLYTTDLTPVKDDLVELLYSQPLTLPYEWAYIARTIGILIAVTATLSPETNLISEFRDVSKRILKESMPEIVERYVKKIVDSAKTAVTLPGKIDSFMANMERGYYHMKVDYNEVMDKADEIKVFLVRIVAFLVTAGSGAAGLVLYRDNPFAAYIFIGAAITALGVTLFYRRRSGRDKIRNSF